MVDLIKIDHNDFCMYVQNERFDDIWKNALGNMENDANRLLCTYNWSDEKAQVTINEETIKSGDKHSAIFFDNADYSIWVDFKDTCKVKDAFFDSNIKKVVNKFPFRVNRQSLSGYLNYNNEIGKSDFILNYTLDKTGEIRSFRFSFEVLSTKLDYHEHWKVIVNDIEAEYRMLSIDFLKRTYHSFSEGDSSEETHDLIWWQIFQPLVNDFLNAAEAILRKPRHRLKTEEFYERADKIKRFTPQLENEFAEHRYNEPYLYRTEINVNHHNTQENQFFKFALFDIAQQHKRLGKKIVEDKRMSEENKKNINNSIESFDNLCSNPFFRTISSWKGELRNSLVIFRDVHYAEIMRTWSILHESYALNDGIHSLETKDIATLYEIWCYIQMKNIVKEQLSTRGEIEVIDEDRHEMNKRFIRNKKKGEKSRILFKQNDIELAELYYNDEEDEKKAVRKEDLKMGELESLTVPQKPDIMLQLIKHQKEEGFKLTYLFDAKYRIDNKDENNVDTPPSDAIDQMHRYRDAIYYREHDDNSLKKEIVGGYILFPGNGRKTDVEISHFYESIKAVNIGAFPLRPKSDENRQLLEDFVGQLIDRDASSVLGDSIPQKGLYYTEFDDFDDLVVVAICKNDDQIDWIINNKWYNTPLDKVNETPLMMKAKYILLHKSNESVSSCVLPIAKGGFEVWTKEKLMNNDGHEPYPYAPSKDAYFMFKLGSADKLPESIKDFSFKFIDAKYIKSNHKQPIAFIKLKDLIGTKVI